MQLRDRTLGIVLGHGKAQAAIERHLPVWRENASAIMLFTPVNDVLITDFPQYSIGKSDAYSAHTNERTRAALRFASYADVEYVLLMEWDSLIFGPIPPKLYPSESFPITCPRFGDTPGGKFKGSQFLHFPILLRQFACKRLVRIMDAIPLEAEGGLTDRYVGYAAELAGLRVNNIVDTPLVYTWNHITPAMIPAAVSAVQAGARWHHGIKDKAVFDAMQAAAKQGT